MQSRYGPKHVVDWEVTDVSTFTNVTVACREKSTLFVVAPRAVKPNPRVRQCIEEAEAKLKGKKGNKAWK
jgi:hypothetical protein